MEKPDWVRPSLDEASDRVLSLLIGQSTWLTSKWISERLKYRDGEVRTAIERLVRDGYARARGWVAGSGETTYEHTLEGAEFMQAGGYRVVNKPPQQPRPIQEPQQEIGMAYGDYTKEQIILHLLKHIENRSFNGLGIDSQNVRISVAPKIKREQFDAALAWAETHKIIRRNDHGDLLPDIEGYAILDAVSIEAWKEGRASGRDPQIRVDNSPGAVVGVGGPVSASTASGVHSRSEYRPAKDNTTSTNSTIAKPKTHWLQIVAWIAAGILAIIGVYKVSKGDGPN